MSREGVVKLITRALEDEKFRGEIKANPEAALAQFDLTAEEIAAIKSGDTSRLGDVAVDERVSKLASVSQYLPQSLSSTTYVPTAVVPGQTPSTESSTESLIAWVFNLFS